MLPFALAVAWSASRTRLERQNEVSDQAVSIAVSAASLLDQYFAGLDAMAAAVARQPVVVSFDRDKVDRFLTDLLASQRLAANLVLTSSEGRVLGSSVTVPPQVLARSFGCKSAISTANGACSAYAAAKATRIASRCCRPP